MYSYPSPIPKQVIKLGNQNYKKEQIKVIKVQKPFAYNQL